MFPHVIKESSVYLLLIAIYYPSKWMSRYLFINTLLLDIYATFHVIV